jgi:perosamine synthetase
VEGALRMIPVYEPLLDGNEQNYVQDCLATGWVSSLGKYVNRFEDNFAAYCGVQHGVSVSSGTTALHLSLVALGIGPGDEVIIPAFTLIVSANVVIQTGARPVLVDVDERTWCMDVNQVEAAITPRTRAIMAVHVYGHPCEMDALVELAERHGLFLIEDGAEAHGAEVRGRRVGSFGIANCFSFYGNKIITTGEGGMVLTDDDALAERLRLLRSQAFQEPRFVHEYMGFNYRLTNVQAAIGCAQLEQLDSRIEAKRSIAQTYLDLIAGDLRIQVPYEAPWAKNVYWMFGIVLDESFGADRQQVMRQLRENGVETRSFFCPMHWQPVFQTGNDPRFPDCSGSFPVSERLWLNGLYLPSGPSLTESDVSEIVEKLMDCAH